jgi:hypothetical protein
MPVQHFADPQRKGRHYERRSFGIYVFGRQSMPQQPVHRPLEGVARAPLLLLHEHGNVIVDGESLPHIMMFSLEASLCQASQKPGNGMFRICR